MEISILFLLAERIFLPPFQQVQKNKMDVDKAFANLGNPGAYNVVLYCIFFTSNAFVSFNHVALSSMYGVSIPHKYVSLYLYKVA